MNVIPYLEKRIKSLTRQLEAYTTLLEIEKAGMVEPGPTEPVVEEAKPKKAKPGPKPRRPTTVNKAQTVLELLQSHGAAGATPSTLREELEQKVPGAHPNTVHSTLHSLKKHKIAKVRANGNYVLVNKPV